MDEEGAPSPLRQVVFDLRPEQCNQCGKCSSGCPSARFLDLRPRRIVAMAQSNMVGEILRSGAIWQCTQCLQCAERCPRDVSPHDLIIALQNLAVRRGLPPPEGLARMLSSVRAYGSIQPPQEVFGKDFEAYLRDSLGLPSPTMPKDIRSFAGSLDKALAGGWAHGTVRPRGRAERRMAGGASRYALFLGCTVQTEQYGFEMSTRLTLPRLGVDLVDVGGFGCCGYPLRSLNSFAWVYLSARNLAISDDLGLDVLPICNGCHLSLSEVKYYLESDPGLKTSVNEALAAEGLRYTGRSEVLHLVEVLHNDVGVDRIRSSVRTPLEGLRLASHYGCHALRPSSIGRADDAEDPRLLDELVAALGAEAGDYPEKLDCCGASLVVSDPEVALKMTGLKLKAVQRDGFDAMVTVCPFCHKMYDAKQSAARRLLGEEDLALPVLYYTQLLGLSLGLDAAKLGVNLNLSPVEGILERMGGSGP